MHYTLCTIHYTHCISDSLKKMTLELGGNDPAIILPGTDIKTVAPQVYTIH
jgi:acyl-CoA reductase-like NAD-dependent aldehyde dehydrogenase